MIFAKKIQKGQNNILRFVLKNQKSIQNEGETLWNDLPHYLKTAETKVSFKRLYKSHLFGPPLISET